MAALLAQAAWCSPMCLMGLSLPTADRPSPTGMRGDLLVRDQWINDLFWLSRSTVPPRSRYRCLRTMCRARTLPPRAGRVNTTFTISRTLGAVHPDCTLQQGEGY
jgi:hypothetical protein